MLYLSACDVDRGNNVGGLGIEASDGPGHRRADHVLADVQFDHALHVRQEMVSDDRTSYTDLARYGLPASSDPAQNTSYNCHNKTGKATADRRLVKNK